MSLGQRAFLALAGRTDFEGCIGYMSPEVLGTAREPTGTFYCQSDMWSLGCAIYELVTGHTPFATRKCSKDLQEQQHVECVRKQHRQTVQPVLLCLQ